MGKKAKHKRVATYHSSFRALAASIAAAAAEKRAAGKNKAQNNTEQDNTAKDNTDKYATENVTASANDVHTDADAGEPAIQIRSALDYPRQPVEWLWPEKIPLGKVTLLIGDPGLGKSLIAIDVAARVSTGNAFPDFSPPNPEPRNLNPLPGSVLILSANDEISDTIRPRLDAHGADPAKIFFAPQLTDLRRDLAKLTATLDRLPDCRLIVVDPVNAYVGPSDSHFHTIVRKVFAPLGELAANKRIAILAVTHLRKNTGRAIQSAAGSMGFVAAARTVWTVCKDETQRRDESQCRDEATERRGPTAPVRHLLLPVKNNVGPLPAGLAFTIETYPDFDAPIIRWQSEPVPTSVEDVGKPQPKSRGPAADDRRNAGEWLKLALADGPHEAWLIRREGKQNGFSDRTLSRALYDIGGQTTKRGYFDGWFWSLPICDAEAPPPIQSQRDKRDKGPAEACPTEQPGVEKPAVEKPGVFDETWHLREKPARNGASSSPGKPPEESPWPEPLAPISVAPTLAESIAFPNQLDSERNPQDLEAAPASAEKDSPTGHPLLDQVLAELRESLTTPNPQPATLHTQRSTQPRAKKSARSHSRFLREPTPGTSLAQRTTHDPERCIAATFPPM